MDKCVGPDKGKTKVVEAAGIPVTSGVKKDPFIINECNYIEKCDSDQNTDCSKSNVVYRVTCMLCKENDIKSVYTGTTGCSLHKRLIEHSNAVNNQDSKNAMYKHMSGKHPGAEPKFSTMVLDRQKFNMQRYISESLYIESSTKEEGTLVMNSKSEWGRQKLTRIKIVDNT